MSESETMLDFGVSVCPDCDEEVNVADLHAVNGGEVCSACFSLYHECEECHEFTKDIDRRDDTEKWFCDDCYDGRHVCSQCEELTDDFENVDGDWWCRDCLDDAGYSQCERCNTWVEDTVTVHTNPGRYRTVEYWCEACADANADTCEDCDERWTDCESIDGRSVCCSCLDAHYIYCEDCEEYHHENEDCPRCRGRSETWDADVDVLDGVPTEAFGMRAVGVELETGHGADDQDFVEDFRRDLPAWGYTTDSSLDVDARELVSPPMSGDVIEWHISDVYDLMNQHDVTINSVLAGAHVHVDFQDVWSVLRQWHDETARPGTRRYAGMDDDLYCWGNACVRIVKLFVSPSRAAKRHCCGGFAIRPCDTASCRRASKKLSAVAYPTIAARRNTLEFRIWPSTANLKNMLARVELSQKLVSRFADCFSDARKRHRMTRRIEIVAQMIIEGHGHAAVNKLARLLGLSLECHTTLVALGMKYHMLHMDLMHPEEKEA